MKKIEFVPLFEQFILEWSDNYEDIYRMRTEHHIDSVKYLYDLMADANIIPEKDINYDEVEIQIHILFL